MRFSRLPAVLLAAASLTALSACSKGEPPAATYELSIKDHHFVPDTLEVISGKRIALNIHNEDPAAEEFESHELNREKVIPAGQTLTVLVGPLTAGTAYPFFGDFHQDTAQGKLIAK